MNMDSQVATDAAAFGEGFGLRDTDDTDVPAPTVEPKADPTPKVDPAPTEDTTDYKALYEKEAERLRALQGKYNAEVPRLHAELKEVKEAAARPAAPAGDTDIGGEDDDLPDDLRAAFDDMPTVLGAVDQLVKHRSKSILRETRREVETVTKPLAEKLEPAVAQAQKAAEAEHFGAIASAHADWKQVVGDPAFKDWTEKLPAYRRGPVQQVLAEGDAASVIEVLTDFKRESGYQSPAHGGGDDDLAIVGRRSGGPKPGANPGGNSDDFNAGFNMD